MVVHDDDDDDEAAFLLLEKTSPTSMRYLSSGSGSEDDPAPCGDTGGRRGDV